METKHYGIPVNSEVPTTGVFSYHSAEFIQDDMYLGDTITDCCIGCNLPNTDDFACENCEYDTENSTVYIGCILTDDNKVDIDPKAEYSAVCGGLYIQVIKSKYVIHGALCSPCYPGQVDAETPGDYQGYSLPPNIIGDMNPELVKRITRIPEQGTIRF